MTNDPSEPAEKEKRQKRKDKKAPEGESPAPLEPASE
jgi:hypothetical protein